MDHEHDERIVCKGFQIPKFALIMDFYLKNGINTRFCNSKAKRKIENDLFHKIGAT